MDKKATHHQSFQISTAMNTVDSRLPYNRQKYADCWIHQFARWVEKNIKQPAPEIIADGEEHEIEPDVSYSLDFSGDHPHGYLTGVGMCGAGKSWFPSYRNEQGELDAGQLIAGKGDAFREATWRQPSEQDRTILPGWDIPKGREVYLPALITARPEKQLQTRIYGWELSTIAIELETPEQPTIAVAIKTVGPGILPPGCGEFNPKQRVVLELRKIHNGARLMGILGPESIGRLSSRRS